MAGRIPQSFIDELMNRVDVVEVIDARVPLKKAGKEYKACCPFHGEKTPSFTVSQSKQFYHCFGCGAHGTAVGFLMEYEHMPFPDAIEELAHMVGMDVPREAVRQETIKRRSESDELYQLMEQSDTFYQQQLRHHAQAKIAVDYLKGRGVSGQIAKEFGIGFAPNGWDLLMNELATDDKTREQLIKAGMLIQKDDASGKCYDRFRNRIMFPIRDRRGRTIAFGGRALSSDDKAKYLNSPETPLFHKGRELYGLYEARKALRDIPRLVVVEGYMDVVSLAQFGIRNAVATLGTATTADHLNRLFRITNEVVFCFDGDRAGRDAAWRALENALPVMKEGMQVRFMFLPDGEDPDTLVRKQGKEAFEAEINKAQAFSDFFFNNLQKDIELSTPEGGAMLCNRAIPYLSQLPAGTYRNLMLKHLAKLSREDLDAILNMIEESSAAAEFNELPPEPPLPDFPADMEPPAGFDDYQPQTSSYRPQPFARNRKQPPSLVRMAMQLLLRKPELAQLANTDVIRSINRPGMPLLVEVLEILKAHPHLNSAGLLMRYQSTEHEAHLNTLMSQQLLLQDDESLVPEFTSTLEKLAQASKEDRIDFLSAKRPNQLTDDEKAELRQLMART